MTSQELKTIDQQYVCSTYARFDLCVERGHGATCYSPEGKKYIDFSTGIGADSLGFCDADWVQAVSEQTGRVDMAMGSVWKERVGDSFYALLSQADQEMYDDKHYRRLQGQICRE